MPALSQDVKMLIALKAVRTITDIFLSTFLIAHFLNAADNNIVPISLYNLAWSIAIPLSFIAIGSFIKQKNKLISFRISAMMNLVYLLCIIVLKERIIDYIVLFGLWYGISATTYAFPLNVMISEKVGKRNLPKFVGYAAAICSLTSVLMPLLFGIFITASSYEKTAEILVFFTILEFATSFFIKRGKEEAEPFKPMRLLKSVKKDYLLRQAYVIEYFRGLAMSSGALNVVIILYVIYIFKTNLNLGIFTSVFALFTIALNFLFGHRAKRDHFTKILSISMVLITLGSILFVINPANYSLIFYNFCFATAGQILNSINDVNLFNVSNHARYKDTLRIEFFAVRELFLNAGRATSFILLFILASVANFELIKYLLLFLTFTIVLVAYLSLRLNKELTDED